MPDILLFAGTSEGRELSEWLSERQISHFISVATEYGEQVLKESRWASVLCGRMDLEKMEDFISEQKIKTLVDATHPFAKEVTENIKAAAAQKGVRYLRLDRGREDGEMVPEGERHYFKDAEECAEALKETKGNILLTTGSKDLKKYCQEESVRQRLYVRVLPAMESLAICQENAISGKNIIAMQGPFSEKMNRLLIQELDIKVLVTKASGKKGGFFEKAEAAVKENINCFIIGEPENAHGMSFAQVCREIRKEEEKSIQINLIGCGMGQEDSLTGEARKALKKAELVFGAERLLNSLHIEGDAYPYYLAEKIIPLLKEKRKDTAVLFSGDSGFYSGAAKLSKAIKEEIKKGELKAELHIYPGVSAISQLAAGFQISWEDAKIFSSHGKKNWERRLGSLVRENKKLFMLLSGLDDLKKIGKILMQEGLEDCSLLVAYQMSNEGERFLCLKPEECERLTGEGLYSILIQNPSAKAPFVSCGISDQEFLRGKVPMTKEEIRHISVDMLRLRKDSVVYDIGSGSGSVAVEMASLSPEIQVYAIECRKEAADLIEKNREHFSLKNISLIRAKAPEGLEDLPKPSHAFIGGSKGELLQIIECLLKKNPQIQIVVNAVSLETISQLTKLEERFEIEELQISSIQVSKSQRLGNYHLMKGENPIWICSFKGKKHE